MEPCCRCGLMLWVLMAPSVSSMEKRDSSTVGCCILYPGAAINEVLVSECWEAPG